MMDQLSDKFPGEKISYNDYQVFLPGDIYLATKLPFDGKVRQKTEEAMWALGDFSNATQSFANAAVLIQAYKHKEATATSSIEGTAASVEDVYAARVSTSGSNGTDSKKEGDIEEINAYLNALEKSQELLEKIPLCNHLLRETHAVLLDQARGKNKSPGKFRTGEVWIGADNPKNASFNPPSVNYVAPAMSNLEKFMQDDSTDVQISPLVKVALLHYQFEIIHPFFDGNGRLGRLLITLYLQSRGLIEEPSLHISDYLSRHRDHYFMNLNQARNSNEWLADWVVFLLVAIIEAARQGKATAERINKLKKDCRDKITSSTKIKIKQQMDCLELLFLNPVTTIAHIQQELKIERNAAARMIKRFTELGILSQQSDNRRNKTHTFKQYMDLIEHKKEVF